MTNMKPLIKSYTGETLKNKSNPIPGLSHDFIFKDKKFVKIESEKTKGEPVELDPYHPSDELQETVQLMQILQRPLLLRGEPGCGKTKVAQAVAYEWYREKYSRYYFEWHVKSTSKAQDGLYSFDHIARLRNAHAAGHGKTEEKKDGEMDNKKEEEDLTKYRTLGPLGKAFLASQEGMPAILLIDEIDKADIDFPNDLLLELDEMRFKIPETGEEIIAKYRPLIFITSNQERELPQAFLRRCLFHFIKFPDKKRLKEIIDANFPSLATSNDENDEPTEEAQFVNAAIARFEQLRNDIKKNPTANKSISTSELKDWMRILEHFYQQGKKPDPSTLPYYSALVKTENDLKSLKILTE